MNAREDVVAAVVEVAGGRLTGRVRLQKTVYLLDQLGLNSGFSYEYYHYGPYASDLDNAMADARAFGLIEEDFGHRVSDGAMYSIFQLKSPPKQEVFADQLNRERAKKLVGLFARTNITVLELAATIDWLWRKEGSDDWRREITRRKGVKVQGGRLDKAVELLNKIGLAPPQAAAA
ncbi:MAG: hypothetical protein R3D62_06505 [Xanthobacteraceae bacterium]